MIAKDIKKKGIRMDNNKITLYFKDGTHKVFDNSKYSFSTNNNAVYIYDSNRKVRGIYNLDYICGAISNNASGNNDYIIEFPTKPSSILIKADTYEYNVYTSELIFKSFDSANKSKAIGTFIMSNIKGFQLYIPNEDNDI